MKIGIFTKIDIERDNPHSFIFKMKYNKKDQLLGEGVINKLKDQEKNKFTIAFVHNNFLFDQLRIRNERNT